MVTVSRVRENIVGVEKHHGVDSTAARAAGAGTGWAFGEMEIQLSGYDLPGT
jgi:hypothetical protein